jgi:hypothetical protein
VEWAMMDFEPAELHAIGLMQRARKTLPDDFWLVAGFQELACLYARIEPLLTDAQKQTLIGCGALMAKESEKEMKSDILARIAIARAMPSANRSEP